MSESTLTVSPVVTKIATGGAIGMCAGFLAAPEKYSLKRLLVQKSDGFSRIFTPSITKKMNAAQLHALDEIQKASDTFFLSGHAERNNVKTAATGWAAKFRAVAIDETLAQEVKNKKNYLKNIAEKNNFSTIRNQYIHARELLLEDLSNKSMREYFKKVKQQYKIAKKNLKKPTEEYRAVMKEARRQRLQNIKNKPTENIDIKLAYEKLQKAIAAKRTVTSNKLYELINQKDLKNNYKSISKFLPKARTRAAIQGALILSTLTAMGIIFFNPSPPNNN